MEFRCTWEDAAAAGQFFVVVNSIVPVYLLFLSFPHSIPVVDNYLFPRLAPARLLQ